MEQVTLEQVLSAREARVLRQQQLSDRFHAPVISFCLNVAGPVKDSPLLRRAFALGRESLESALQANGFRLEAREETIAVTGCEMQYAVCGNALALKQLCVNVEDASPIGRLFDMDVLTADGQKIDRTAIGLGERGCIVCGAAGRGCASRRVHSVADLQRATRRLLSEHFQRADAQTVSALATNALLDEVYTTPKPGLVDQNNTGSHRDMTVSTFERSAAALTSYWEACVQLGMQTADLPAAEAFLPLRAAGLKAERSMFAATNGVNTHKGAIFLLGILCGAVGRLWTPERPFAPTDRLLAEGGMLCRDAVEADFAALKKAPEAAQTKGQALYLSHGIRGARGEAADGFLGVWQTALPAFSTALSRGCSRNDAAAIALLALIARGKDTNLIVRGGLASAAEAAHAAAALLAENPLPAMHRIEALDASFIEKNLSPGGSADLLAATLFLYDLAEIS